MAVRTVHLGFGPIGQAVFDLVEQSPYATASGIVDLDTTRVVAQMPADWSAARLPVVSNLAELPAAAADVVVHCTGSRLAAVSSQIIEALSLGCAVISTCEELSFPWREHAAIAKEIDSFAKEKQRAVLSTGINPGFAMDTLPLLLSVATRSVEAVRVQRVVDAARRRGPLQQKIAAGVTREEFAKRAAGGTVGHVGLRESVAMLAAGMDVSIDSITSKLEPVIGEADIETEFVQVKAGRVAGIHQVATGWIGTREFITLELRMYIGAHPEGDEIEIFGDPSLQLALRGLHGDVATATIVANMIPEMRRLSPGLRTMADVLHIRSGHGPAPSAE